jgi:predicted ATPase
MLIRLHIDGFKNLREVALRFGPLTCVAGRNGVGKSNLFDAIQLLSDLASMPLAKAATRVRGTGGRLSGVASLFDRTGPGQACLVLEADMVVPRYVHDDFDRPAEATATCLRYRIKLGLRVGDAEDTGQALELLEEDLRALSLDAAAKELKFGPDKAWTKRFLKGPGSRTSPFIDTTDGVIRLWGDKGHGGRQAGVPAAKSPQTVLASVDASTHPTALAAKREMQSWRQLQLEPSALRKPDDFRDEDRISHTGAHLPNALRRIGRGLELADLLSQLIPGVLSVDVDSDPARQQRVLKVRLRDQQPYDASSLSDGTLRFIALGLLGLDPLTTGLTCLEEPENGIHPQRIPEVMRLIKLLAQDVELEDDALDQGDSAVLGASPRQVIINTHSPLVAGALDDDTLLMADTVQYLGREWARFKPLAGTWRAEGLKLTELASKGMLDRYLEGPLTVSAPQQPGKRLVRDHATRDMFQD